MKNRSLIFGLAALFLGVGAAETRSQDCRVPCQRPETLIDLFQQRLCGVVCDCDCAPKSQIQKHAVAEKVAPVTKATTIQKALPVQKAPCVQKSGCRRELSDGILTCEPCGFSRPRPVAGLLSRWNGTLPRICPPVVSSSPSKAGKGVVATKDRPRSHKGCGCEPDLPTDLSVPIPMIERPRIDNNPFRDDALQPAPLRGASIREARVLPRPSTNDPADSATQQPVVRHASYYLLSVETD